MDDSHLLPGQSLAHLLPPSWKEQVYEWYREDTPSFDWGGFVVGEEEQEAILWGKSGVGTHCFFCSSRVLNESIRRVYWPECRSSKKSLDVPDAREPPPTMNTEGSMLSMTWQRRVAHAGRFSHTAKHEDESGHCSRQG